MSGLISIHLGKMLISLIKHFHSNQERFSKESRSKVEVPHYWWQVGRDWTITWQNVINSFFLSFLKPLGNSFSFSHEKDPKTRRWNILGCCHPSEISRVWLNDPVLVSSEFFVAGWTLILGSGRCACERRETQEMQPSFYELSIN